MKKKIHETIRYSSLFLFLFRSRSELYLFSHLSLLSLFLSFFLSLYPSLYLTVLVAFVFSLYDITPSTSRDLKSPPPPSAQTATASPPSPCAARSFIPPFSLAAEKKKKQSLSFCLFSLSCYANAGTPLCGKVYHTQKDQVQKKAKLKDIFSSDFVGTQLLHNNNQPPSPLSLQQQQETTNSST